ncbi:MAG TPA: polysaccharide deacetylase family protein [Candidatus Limnocylindrales bacterium]
MPQPKFDLWVGSPPARPVRRVSPWRGRTLLLAAILVGACAAPRPVPSTPAGATQSPAPTTLPDPGPSPAATLALPPSPGPSCPPGCGAPAPAQFARHGSRANKVVALTFDDGFNVPACISIVDTLLAEGVPATFFPNGQYVRESPSFWHWVAANGFPVGNHTTTHNDPRSLAATALGLSLDSDRRIADAALGVPSINVYRPPYGDYDLVVQQVAADEGYPILVGWDVDSRDQNGVASTAVEVSNATTGINGSIVLMHCGSRLTPLALPAIIARYRSRGFTFVTIPELLGLAAPSASWNPPPNPDIWATSQADPAQAGPSWNASPAVDAAGHLHLAYETSTGIVYGDDTSGPWQYATVATTTGGTFVSRPSIALDPSGGIDLVYLSMTNAGTTVMYEHMTSASVWSNPVPVTQLGAPASTATIATDGGGQPVIAFALLAGGREGIMLARPTATGWSASHVPTTNGTFLNPTIAIDQHGSIHLVERRNGYPELDETTDASGSWTTRPLRAVAGSAVPFAAFDPLGRLTIAAQQTYASAITFGVRQLTGSITWSTVTGAGDLSGLALAPDGSPVVAFSRVASSNHPSQVWLARGDHPSTAAPTWRSSPATTRTSPKN